MANDLVFKVPLLFRNSNGIEKGALHFSSQVPKNFFYFGNDYCIFCNTRQLLIYVESSLIGWKLSLVVTRAFWLVKNRHFCLENWRQFSDWSIGGNVDMQNLKKNINWIEKPKEHFGKALFLITLKQFITSSMWKTRQ